MLPSACNDSVGALIAPFRSSIPSPPIPLFTLRRAPRGTQRKTRGRAVRYSFLVRLFHSLLRAGLSRRSITRPHRSYSPLRLPDWPPPFLATFGAATPSQSRASLTDLRSPSLHAVLNTPVDRIRCSLVDELRDPAPGFFPVRTAFPVIGAGRRPHHYFRGLLKLHTRYGLQSCSPTIRGLYREAPPWPVSRLGRSQATEFNQQPPWVGPPPTGDLRR